MRKVGHGRGVPIRLLSAIARKYSLTHFVAYTRDRQQRSRILYWASNDLGAMQCAKYSCELADQLGWDGIVDWDCSSVRQLKSRIKELETALAQIADRVPDPVGLARAAGKFPDEEDGNLGLWVFYPQSKANPAFRTFASHLAPRRAPGLGEARRKAI